MMLGSATARGCTRVLFLLFVLCAALASVEGKKHVRHRMQKGDIPAHGPAEKAMSPAELPESLKKQSGALIKQITGALKERHPKDTHVPRAGGAPEDWTDCTNACGGGSRTDTTGTYADIPCNTFSCNFTVDCTCGESDLVFLLDESGSLETYNFYVAKQFLIDVVTGLHRVADPENMDTRVSLVTFSAGATIVFDFNAGYSLNNLTALSDAIWYTPYESGADTNTAEALVAALNLYETQGDPTKSPITILISDGATTVYKGDVIPAADALKEHGTQVFTIGITTSVDEVELKAIASDPDEYFYFYVSDFDQLYNIIEQVLNGTCCVDTCPIFECTLTESGQCSEKCGGGVNWVEQVCVCKDQDGTIFSETRENITTTSCCDIPCPPAVADCKNCNFTDNVGYLPDLANCHCYYQCEIIGPNDYRQYHMCCPDGLYWNQPFLTCSYTHLPGCLEPPYDNCDTNPWNTPPPTGDPVTTTTTPCPYTQSPDDPADYMLGNQIVGTCGSGLIWSELECTCVPGGSLPPCQSDALLHYPFDVDLHDHACLGAHTEDHFTTQLVAGGVKGNAAQFTGSNFLTVPMMNNYLAGRAVDKWTVALWVTREGDTNVHMGLVNNGDCLKDPSWTVFLTMGEQASAGVTTWEDPQSRTTLVPIPVSSHVWIHLAMVYDGANIRFYYNGVKQANQEPKTRALVNKQCPMTIGVQATDTEPGIFVGLMDELLIYERALSDSEILGLYQNP